MTCIYDALRWAVKQEFTRVEAMRILRLMPSRLIPFALGCRDYIASVNPADLLKRLHLWRSNRLLCKFFHYNLRWDFFKFNFCLIYYYWWGLIRLCLTVNVNYLFYLAHLTRDRTAINIAFWCHNLTFWQHEPTISLQVLRDFCAYRDYITSTRLILLLLDLITR